MDIEKNIIKKYNDILLEGGEYNDDSSTDGSSNIFSKIWGGIKIFIAIFIISIQVIILFYVFRFLYNSYKWICKKLCWRHIISTSKRNKCKRNCSFRTIDFAFSKGGKFLSFVDVIIDKILDIVY